MGVGWYGYDAQSGTWVEVEGSGSGSGSGLGLGSSSRHWRR